MLVDLFGIPRGDPAVGEQLFNDALFDRFFRLRARRLGRRCRISGQQIVHVKTGLGVLNLAYHGVMFAFGFHRIRPFTFWRQPFALTAGVRLQPVFNRFLLALNGPAQLLLAHLIAGLLQIAAELLADFGRQR